MNNMFLKWLWIPQAKQLIKLFKADLIQLVNGLIKIDKQYQIDFSFVDKVISNLTGIDRDLLQNALHDIENNSSTKKKGFTTRSSQKALQTITDSPAVT